MIEAPGNNAEGARGPISLRQLAEVLVQLGAPADKADAMAAQLDKRATQLASEKSRSYEEAMTHLLGLMRQGWAAKERQC